MTYKDNTITKRAQKLSNQLITWRRWLHQYPELSFHEFETATFVANILREIPGMEVEIGVGYPTAVVGRLSSGKGPSIAIRADMDALPIQEKNEKVYRSRHDGVMHACGHDAHMTIALGSAVILADYLKENKLQGTVTFLFQPAEETMDASGLTGAAYMVQAGVLEEVEAVFALHMDPEHPLGEVNVHDGYSMASVDMFQAKLVATGGHGAYPHLGTDPVWMLAPVLQAIHSIVARRISPLDSAVISIGKIQTGTTSNVIPSEIEMEGTIRSYKPEVRKRLHIELEKAISLVRHFEGEYELEIIPENPPLKNNATVNRYVKETIDELYPHFKIRNNPFGLGGEDFSHMTEKVPGAMFFLGCAIGDGVPRQLHTPYFDIDEKVLPVGAAIMAQTVRDILNERALKIEE